MDTPGSLSGHTGWTCKAHWACWVGTPGGHTGLTGLTGHSGSTHSSLGVLGRHTGPIRLTGQAHWAHRAHWAGALGLLGVLGGLLWPAAGPCLRWAMGALSPTPKRHMGDCLQSSWSGSRDVDTEEMETDLRPLRPQRGRKSTGPRGTPHDHHPTAPPSHMTTPTSTAAGGPPRTGQVSGDPNTQGAWQK